jgi:hypothetical protein
MRLSYSRNLLVLLLVCFIDQYSRYHFDSIVMPVADTFAYSVILIVVMTTSTVILAAGMLPAAATSPQTIASQHEKEFAPN